MQIYKIVTFVLLMVIIVISLYHIYINVPSYTYRINHTPTLLHLVLYNERTEYERNMKEVTEAYYQRFPYLHTYYYTYSDSIKEISVVGNTCYIPGKESMFPGVLDKTMKAITHFMGKEHPYEYLIRSNISTVVNFSILTPNLHSFDYGGPMMLAYMDFTHGELKHLFTKYISGTCILLSRRVVRAMVSNTHSIDYTIMDDASIGYFIETYLPDTRYKTFFNEYKCYGMNRTRATDIHMFYRNKSKDRNKDVLYMKKLVHQLSQTI